jgi:hypothetical protein
VAGGSQNTADGRYSTVAGGSQNSATGSHSFAAGYRAQAQHSGSFVWADSTEADFASTTGREFAVRAGGGVRLQTSKVTVGPAKSYVWISGNGVRKFEESDSTIIDMGNKGEAVITRGADSGKKNVMLPITITGPLYGQEVTVTDLDIWFKCETDLDFISALLLRRQTGLCDTSDCYETLHSIHAPLKCDGSTHPEGCPWNFSVSSNNLLTPDHGILYLTLELTFSSDTSRIWLGGARMTLEHD